MQEASLVVALNFVVVLACTRVCVAYGRWAWRSRRELALQPLGALPACIWWFSLAVGVEAAYYGIARVGREFFDVNMWLWALPVNLVRVMLILGALAHMAVYLRASTVKCAKCWLAVDIGVYVASATAIAWYLW